MDGIDCEVRNILLENRCSSEFSASGSFEEIFKSTSTIEPEYAGWRFIKAWQERENGATPDLVVLLRQFVRWMPHTKLPGITSLPDGMDLYIESAGLKLNSSNELVAIPFNPQWLQDQIIDPINGIDKRPKMKRIDEKVRSEHFLWSLGYKHWSSKVQKEAVWTAISALPGSTNLISLPTGSGKSLILQLLSVLEGLTVVVVPTISLAIDHFESSEKLLKNHNVNPRYYVSGQDAQSLAKAIGSGQTKLVFLSPEALISGKMATPITQQIENGTLRNLVIDEAHIIEGWGSHFRVDFQLLATQRRQWMKICEDKGKKIFKTHLLSATYTVSSKKTLRDLFMEPGDNEDKWNETVSQRLRPEMNYYVQELKEEEQRTAVLECAWRLPRPLLVYTTEKEKAKSYFEIIERQKFKRIACFHGDTNNRDRKEIIKRWRDNKIDLIVATSAFGLGVDKQDVRGVVHVCCPEDLNRFYQEVGRGGRDGGENICMLLPTYKDQRIAGYLQTKHLTDSKKIQGRWDAMYEKCERVEDEPGSNVFRIRTDVKPLYLEDNVTGDQNIDWNTSLLLKLHRAKKIELCEKKYLPDNSEDENSEWRNWYKVKIKFSPSDDLPQMINKFTQKEKKLIREGFQSIKDFIGKPDVKACLTIKKVYGEKTYRACGSCRVCRESNRALLCPKLKVAVGKKTDPQLTIVFDTYHPIRDRPKFISSIRDLRYIKGHKWFFCEKAKEDILLEIFENAYKSDVKSFYRLDVLDQDHIPYVRENETIVIFHIDRLIEDKLKIPVGKNVVHLIVKGLRCEDEEGRKLLTHHQPLYFKDIDHYIGEN